MTCSTDKTIREIRRKKHYSSLLNKINRLQVYVVEKSHLLLLYGLWLVTINYRRSPQQKNSSQFFTLSPSAAIAHLFLEFRLMLSLKCPDPWWLWWMRIGVYKRSACSDACRSTGCSRARYPPSTRQKRTYFITNLRLFHWLPVYEWTE